jgi:hypothetical protein
MNNRWNCLFAGLLVLAGCSSARVSNEGATTPAPQPDSVQPAPPPATADLLPRGSEIVVALNDSLSSERTSVGDRFSVSVVDSIATRTGQVVIPRGAVITGLITGIDDSDHAGDEAYIRLNFVRITLGKANHPFAADIVGTDLAVSHGHDLEGAAAGAAAGVLGAVISGDLRSAAEAAGLGAGAGTIISLGSSGKEEVLPAGTTFRIRTTASLQLER